MRWPPYPESVVSMSTNLRGIVFILVSGIFLSSNDAVLKSLVAHYPPGQILFITGTTVALVTWLILKLHGGTGVVVNDSLIMVDFINQAKDKGQRLVDVVIGAGTQRFRAILLTSLTTFFGVLPIYFETSLQAQFIIPMAISLGFGIMFATVITLFLIPALYLIKDDIANKFGSKEVIADNSEYQEV